MNPSTARYGDSVPTIGSDDLACEEIRRIGFTVVRKVLTSGQLEYCRRAIDQQLDAQAMMLAPDQLAAIGELDIVRAPLVNDEFFLLTVAMAPTVRNLAGRLIGGYHLLHLQNAIINRPGRTHHQSAWHRDLPYLDRTSSAPLALSAIFCIDRFSTETGATWCLPGSHLVPEPPSDDFLERHAVPLEADAGDVIVLDSMVMHRAGVNTSGEPRRGINNVYSVGIIRQQIDLPRALGGRYAEDPELAVLLGYESNAPVSAEAYRLQRSRRLGSK